MRSTLSQGSVVALLLSAAGPASAATADFTGPQVSGVAVEFVLFAVVLAGVALFHAYVLPIAVGGVVVIALYKIVASPFKAGSGLSGFLGHLEHESVILVN